MNEYWKQRKRVAAEFRAEVAEIVGKLGPAFRLEPARNTALRALCHRVADEMGSHAHHVGQGAFDVEFAPHIGVGQVANLPADQAGERAAITQLESHRSGADCTGLPAWPFQRQFDGQFERASVLISASGCWSSRPPDAGRPAA